MYKNFKIKAVLILIFVLFISKVYSQGTETFTHASNSSSYATITWTGTNGQLWTANDSRGDQVITSSNKAICIRQTAGKLTGVLTTAQKNAGIGVISFTAKNTAATSDNTKTTTYQFKCGSITKSVTVNAMGLNSAIVTSPAINSNDALNIEITITGESGVRITIDDLSWTAATPTCTASNLAFTEASVNRLISDGNFTKTATSLNGTTSISYASSNEAVATVNASTGEVTPLTVGSTTITATQVAGTHNAVDYCAATATYTVNLTAATPTITVTEVEVPAMMAYAGETDTEIIHVSGVNLTDNISLAIEGTNANLFSLSVNSVSQTAGTVANTSITISYNPLSPGTHTATLKLSSGALNITRALNGSSTWRPLLTPVATDASNISNTGFTANWGAVQGATEYELNVSQITNIEALATDLFISEYIEGTSNNKAIEIFNGTGAPVNLSTYSLKKQTNGSGAYADELVLSGTVANGDVYVVANSQANAGIQAAADLSTSSAAMSFNGNDAIGLFKNATQIDEVGVFSLTSNWGADVTLIRKNTVLSPKVPYSATDWNSNATDYVTNLGSHTINGSSFSITPILGSPFTVTGDNSKTFTNLTSATNYSYSVKAKNANVSSSLSNSINVITSTGTSLPSIKNTLKFYVSNNRLIIDAKSEIKVNIYNAVGQLISAQKLSVGKNELNVILKGVCIVQTENESYKVVL